MLLFVILSLSLCGILKRSQQPEKIAKSKTFLATLQKMANNGKLVRIVIDEAHCVSQLGHDFRPDYQKLSILRQLFPHVPILALSATCPPKVMKDLLSVLKMPPVVDGKSQ
jgi:ATP-dependent DNA helicase Q1